MSVPAEIDQEEENLGRYPGRICGCIYSSSTRRVFTHSANLKFTVEVHYEIRKQEKECPLLNLCIVISFDLNSIICEYSLN